MVFRIAHLRITSELHYSNYHGPAAGSTNASVVCAGSPASQGKAVECAPIWNMLGYQLMYRSLSALMQRCELCRDWSSINTRLHSVQRSSTRGMAYISHKKSFPKAKRITTKLHPEK